MTIFNCMDCIHYIDTENPFGTTLSECYLGLPQEGEFECEQFNPLRNEEENNEP